jgi:hypothetical protein
LFSLSVLDPLPLKMPILYSIWRQVLKYQPEISHSQ